MQLALTPEVLFPLGACAVVAVAVIAVVVVFVRGRRTAGDEALAPTSADWTGEAATADPAPTPTVTVPALPQRLTVAEAIAVREADTAPLPVSSIAFLSTRPAAAVPATTGPLPVVPPAAETAAAEAPGEPASTESREAESREAESQKAASQKAESQEAASREAESDEAESRGPESRGPESRGPESRPAEPEAARAEVAEPEVEGPTDVSEPEEPTPALASRVAAESTGSSPVVAAAVAQVLATRAAAGREPGAPAPVPSRTADARDRLLAVLLADPARAVGAAEELATCRGQLSDVLSRLASSGLSTEQLARLSGFSVEQVTTLLAQQRASR